MQCCIGVDEFVDEESLSRARHQLRSAVLMNLELRSINCEDIGRQILTTGHRESGDDLCEKILAVTAEDIRVSSVAYYLVFMYSVCRVTSSSASCAAFCCALNAVFLLSGAHMACNAAVIGRRISLASTINGGVWTP